MVSEVLRKNFIHPSSRTRNPFEVSLYCGTPRRIAPGVENACKDVDEAAEEDEENYHPLQGLPRRDGDLKSLGKPNFEGIIFTTRARAKKNLGPATCR